MDSFVLLTGSSGFLGSSIKRYFTDINCDFLTLGKSCCDFNHDLNNEICFSLPNFDTIIHAAGRAHILYGNVIDHNEFFNTNVNGTINLLNGLQKSTILPKKFVFISSVSVYGKEIGINIKENSPLNALDGYGLSKIEAEKIIINWCKKNNVVCTIFRLPLVVGPNPPGNLGAMINGIKKGYYFNVAGGRAKKSMVLANDVSKFLLKASDIGGIYNLTGKNHPSFAELSKHIAAQLGRKKPVNLPYWLAKIVSLMGDVFGKIVPLNSSKLKKITSDLTFDDTKAKESFGWNPSNVLEGFILGDNL